MNNPLAYSVAASSSVGSDRRLRGRVRQQGVISTLGTVLDLSATGMRVLGTAPPADVQNVQIASERDSIVLRAELVWTKKVGFRRHVSGLRFLDLDETKTQRLCQLAAANRLVVPT